MANHKSAIKRARQNEIKRVRNKVVRTGTKSIIKKVRAAVGENSAKKAMTELNNAKSVIDRAAQRGILHKKNAARKISRLTKLVNSI
ncbi:MAG: 30S ribosomal protein S20 [Deltaproteobacteria bacterium]|nr:30S ribosomal protein S20 [Deltaproteobacteria bacterium]